MKWRLVSLCDKNVFPRLKCNFYRVVVKHDLLHETECWLVKVHMFRNECSR